MPILRIPDANAPLAQGDVLRGLRLYVTDNDWSESETSSGSGCHVQSFDLALVISRPCVAVHKQYILVAGVSPIVGNVPENVQSYEEVQAFLKRLRDGHGQPDRFYLGQIPNEGSGRYYAHLDSLHTVKKPPEEQLRRFLRTNRIGTLTEDFARDLHVRMFACFAPLGFDDYGWLSDRDLAWLVEKGEQKLLEDKIALAPDKSKLAEFDASGGGKQKEIDKRKQAIAARRLEIDQFEQELAGYRAVLRRQQDQSAASQTPTEKPEESS